VLPQEVHHLAEHPDLAVTGGLRAVEDPVGQREERRTIGVAVHQEAGQARLGVEQDQLIAGLGGGHVERRAQALAYGGDVPGRGDEHRRLAVDQARAQVVGHGPDQEALVGVELHDVVTRLG
jgi:hypothetical protein